MKSIASLPPPPAKNATAAQWRAHYEDLLELPDSPAARHAIRAAKKALNSTAQVRGATRGSLAQGYDGDEPFLGSLSRRPIAA